MPSLNISLNCSSDCFKWCPRSIFCCKRKNKTIDEESLEEKVDISAHEALERLKANLEKSGLIKK